MHFQQYWPRKCVNLSDVIFEGPQFMMFLFAFVQTPSCLSSSTHCSRSGPCAGSTHYSCWRLQMRSGCTWVAKETRWVKTSFRDSSLQMFFFYLMSSDGLYCYLIHVYHSVCFTTHVTIPWSLITSIQSICACFGTKHRWKTTQYWFLKNMGNGGIQTRSTVLVL